MITFKEFLLEKAMNRKTYAATEKSHGSTALVGFEFEMWVPSNSAAHPEGNGRWEKKQPSMRIEDFQSSSEVTYFFYDTYQQLKWKEVERNFQKNGRSGISFADWFKEQYNETLTKFIRDLDLEPKYGWASDNAVFTSHDEEGASTTQVFDFIADSLGAAIGKPIKPFANNIHSWRIETDGSIEATDGEEGHGAEVISPPTPLADALKDCQKVFDWMSKGAVETNHSTGLHINISLPNMKDVDLVKLVLFAGETYALKQFGRLNNEYTAPQITRMINHLTGTGELPAEFRKMKEMAARMLSDAKYSSINIKKMANGYLEFRIAGGADYHRDFEKVRNTALRFVTALEIAADHQAEKNEYIKKLSKVFGKAAENDAVEPPAFGLKELLSRGEITHLDGWTEKVKSGKAKHDAAVNYVSTVLVPSLSKALDRADIKKPSPKMRAQFKVWLKRLGVAASEVKGDWDVQKIIQRMNAK